MVIYYQYYYAQNIKLASIFEIDTLLMQYYFSCMYIYIHKISDYATHSRLKPLAVILHNKYEPTSKT